MTHVAERERMIALRWRTRGQVEALTPALDHAYPIDRTTCFDPVLEAIDEAERQVWGDGDPATETSD